MEALPPIYWSPMHDLADRQDVTFKMLRHLDHRYDVQQEMIVALSDRVQQGFQQLQAQLTDLDQDIQAALNAASSVNDQLESQISTLTQLRDALQQEVGADNAEIERLNGVIEEMRATQQTQDDEVLSRLGELSGDVSELDQKVPGGADTNP